MGAEAESRRKAQPKWGCLANFNMQWHEKVCILSGGRISVACRCGLSQPKGRGAALAAGKGRVGLNLGFKGVYNLTATVCSTTFTLGKDKRDCLNLDVVPYVLGLLEVNTACGPFRSLIHASKNREMKNFREAISLRPVKSWQESGGIPCFQTGLQTNLRTRLSTKFRA